MVALSSNVNDHYKEEISMDRKEDVLLGEASHADNNDIQESSSELEELPKNRLMRAFVEAQDPSSKVSVPNPNLNLFINI
ncbi:hypothetical protein L3X38_028815 [Prunus dulcis]|uniref:Uncharacterized protein n=1 Tax=Prunus dulcis TaxID=3755 RepID=A0AAD4VQN7_PRUDU|nr:hypothetical protein L3X38_028815 [Prunus dulcis]